MLATATEPAWGYVTDVEGDMEFWSKFCSMSSVLQGSTDDLSLRPGCHLVFGGDSVDKGGRDLAFLRSLLRLKERHPERVHLLLGNRDINKMRLTAELAPPTGPRVGCVRHSSLSSPRMRPALPP